ncbi:MAG: hypothetical protein ABIV51_09285 [Saprospiraceae bacterium]
MHTGIIESNIDDQMYSLNFGSGNCDKIAELTYPNGKTRIVSIERWW